MPDNSELLNEPSVDDGYDYDSQYNTDNVYVQWATRDSPTTLEMMDVDQLYHHSIFGPGSYARFIGTGIDPTKEDLSIALPKITAFEDTYNSFFAPIGEQVLPKTTSDLDINDYKDLEEAERYRIFTDDYNKAVQYENYLRRQEFIDFNNNDIMRYGQEGIGLVEGADMEYVMEKERPYTWGRAWRRAKLDFVNDWHNNMNALSRFFSTPTEQLEGDASTREMARAFMAGENEIPIFRDRDKSGLVHSVGEFGRDLLVASGNFASSMAMNVVSSLAVSAGMSLASYGLGTVPGLAVGGGRFLIGIGKAFHSAKRAFGFLQNTSKHVSNYRKVRDAMNTSRYLKNLFKESATLMANHVQTSAESSLMADMNAISFLEAAKSEFFINNGRVATPEEEEEIKKAAMDVRKWTYAANYMLVGFSNLQQFGGIVGGLSRLDKMKRGAYRLAKNPTGKKFRLEAKSWWDKNKWEIVKNSFTEGFEEFGQSVIDNTVSSYFKSVLDPRTELAYQNFSNQLSGLIDHSGFGFKSSVAHGGLYEGLIGAVLGGAGSVILPGAMGIAERVKYGKAKNARLEMFNKNIDQYNTLLFGKMRSNTENSNTVAGADTDDTASLTEEVKLEHAGVKDLVEFTSRNYSMDRGDVLLNYLDEVDGLSEAELRVALGLSEDIAIDDIMANLARSRGIIEETLKVRDVLGDAYSYNHLDVKSKWFEDLMKTSKFKGISEDAMKNRIFNDYVGIHTQAIVMDKFFKNDLQERRSELLSELSKKGTFMHDMSQSVYGFSGLGEDLLDLFGVVFGGASYYQQEVDEDYTNRVEDLKSRIRLASTSAEKKSLQDELATVRKNQKEYRDRMGAFEFIEDSDFFVEREEVHTIENNLEIFKGRIRRRLSKGKSLRSAISVKADMERTSLEEREKRLEELREVIRDTEQKYKTASDSEKIKLDAELQQHSRVLKVLESVRSGTLRSEFTQREIFLQSLLDEIEGMSANEALETIVTRFQLSSHVLGILSDYYFRSSASLVFNQEANFLLNPEYQKELFENIADNYAFIATRSKDNPFMGKIGLMYYYHEDGKLYSTGDVNKYNKAKADWENQQKEKAEKAAAEEAVSNQTDGGTDEQTLEEQLRDAEKKRQEKLKDAMGDTATSSKPDPKSETKPEKGMTEGERAASDPGYVKNAIESITGDLSTEEEKTFDSISSILGNCTP